MMQNNKEKSWTETHTYCANHLLFTAQGQAKLWVLNFQEAMQKGEITSYIFNTHKIKINQLFQKHNYGRTKKNSYSESPHKKNIVSIMNTVLNNISKANKK